MKEEAFKEFLEYCRANIDGDEADTSGNATEDQNYVLASVEYTF